MQLFRFMTLRGIPVSVSLGFFVFPVWVGWRGSLIVADFVGDAHPEYVLSPMVLWLVAVAGAGVLALSVFAHEIGHAVVTRAAGGRVEEIQLRFAGGVTVTNMTASAGPGRLWLSVVGGPLVTTAIAAGLAGTASLVAHPVWFYGLMVTAVIQLMLLGYTLLPVGASDGGLLLLGFLWKVSGSLPTAVRVTVAVGVTIGVSVAVAGFLLATAGVMWGLVFMVFGVVWSLQAQSLRTIDVAADPTVAGGDSVLDESGVPLRGVPVEAVMLPLPPAVSADLTVYGVLALGYTELVSVSAGSRIVGVVDPAWLGPLPERSKVGDVVASMPRVEVGTLLGQIRNTSEVGVLVERAGTAVGYVPRGVLGALSRR